MDLTETSTNFDEVRQQALPIPTRIAQGCPGVVVVLSTAVPAHGIQYATASKDFALGHRSGCSVKLCLWRGRQKPVVDAADVCSDVNRVLDDRLILITGHALECSHGRKRYELTRRLLRCRGH